MNSVRIPAGALILIAFISMGVVISIAGSYLIYPGYVDTGEPNIVALAWRILDGYPVYLPVDDAARITNLYGPYLYLIHTAALGVFGGSVMIGKLPGVLALIVGLSFVAYAHRQVGLSAVCLGLAYCAGIVGLNLPATIWDRPETFMFACVAAGVCLNNLEDDRRSRAFRIVGFGILIGMLMGLKAFAPIYFLPFGLLMLFRDGVVACVLTVIFALIVAAFPFAFDTFKFEHLADLLSLMTSKPNSVDELIKVIRYSLYYIVPAVIFTIPIYRHMNSKARQETMLLLAGFIAAILLVMYPAQKPGAGMYYWVPFAPIVADMLVRGLKASQEKQNFLWAAVVMALLVNVLAIPTEKRFWRSLDWQTATGVADEIELITKAHPTKSIEIGIGDNNESYRKTYQRTRLVFDGHPYSLDTSIVIETTAWGIDIKPETIALITTCATDLWLIPAGELPFDWIGYYGNDIYGPAFRAAFGSAYKRIEERTYFDVYACRG